MVSVDVDVREAWFRVCEKDIVKKKQLVDSGNIMVNSALVSLYAVKGGLDVNDFVGLKDESGKLGWILKCAFIGGMMFVKENPECLDLLKYTKLEGSWELFKAAWLGNEKKEMNHVG